MSQILNEHEKAKVLKRLRKMLALTASSNPGEAAAALHQANVLMKKFGLDAAGVEQSDISESCVTASNIKLANWEVILMFVVKESLGVSSIMKSVASTSGKRYKSQIVFIGESSRVPVAVYAFETLRRSLRKSLKESFSEMLKAHGFSPNNNIVINTRQRNAYAEAWCRTVAQSISNLAPTVSDITAQYMETRYGELPNRELTKTRNKAYDPIAALMRNKGIEDGSQVTLHQAVKSDGRSTPQIAMAL